MSKDALIVAVSDFHSGSNWALFLDREWHGHKTSHTPRSQQVKIRGQFEKYAEAVKQKRQGKNVILVHNGDAIDGDHHHSSDVCSVDNVEQADIHIELMIELQRRIDWQAGDKLYYTMGTQTHVNEREHYIVHELGAVESPTGGAWNELHLSVYGVECVFVHHGPMAGKGASEGNAMRAWLKNIYYDALKDSKRPPDIVYTGHVHSPTYAAFSAREQGFTFRNIHGVILPSWQGKTPYAWRVASMQKNRVGGVTHEIKADGTITVPEFHVMETE